MRHPKITRPSCSPPRHIITTLYEQYIILSQTQTTRSVTVKRYLELLWHCEQVLCYRERVLSCCEGVCLWDRAAVVHYSNLYIFRRDYGP